MAWLYQAQTATKGIQLGNEEYGHTMEIGNDWTRLRIGCRIAIPFNQSFDGGGAFPSIGCFALGLCQGTANMLKSPDCTEFLGLILGNSAVTTFTYATSPAAHFFNGRPSYISKIGATITSHVTVSANQFISGSNTVRSVVTIDILKNGGSSFTLVGCMPTNATQGTTDNGYSGFLQSMESNTTPANTAQLTTTTLTHPGQGLLDTVYFGWGKSTPPITLFDLCVCRVI
jgi:hypothetical protein